VYEEDHRFGEKRIGRIARDYEEFADRQIFGLAGLRGQRTGNQQDRRNESNAVEPIAHICNYITKAGTLRGHAAISTRSRPRRDVLNQKLEFCAQRGF
jgi:hypothetical protein